MIRGGQGHNVDTPSGRTKTSGHPGGVRIRGRNLSSSYLMFLGPRSRKILVEERNWTLTVSDGSVWDVDRHFGD